MSVVRLSIFGNCLEPKASRIGLDEVMATIVGPDLAMQTLNVRKAAEKNDMREVKRLKSSAFPALMPGCHCRGGSRLAEEVEELTGVCQADFDHLEGDRLREARERLRADPYVLLLHTSMSGHGLHVFYRWEAFPTPQDTPPLHIYEQAFRQGNEYLARVACADYDPSVESVVHLSCICHDADAYYNPQARPFLRCRPGVRHPLNALRPASP